MAQVVEFFIQRHEEDSQEFVRQVLNHDGYERLGRQNKRAGDNVELDQVDPSR